MNFDQECKNKVLTALFPHLITLKNGKQITVRPLQTDDGNALADFYEDLPPETSFNYCPHPLDREHALKNAAKADDADNVCLVLETDSKKICGYAWYRIRNEQESAFGICIAPAFQGTGCGKQLMLELLDVAKAYGPPVMLLAVQPSNPNALNLYLKMGFEIYEKNRRPAPYNDINYRMKLKLR